MEKEEIRYCGCQGVLEYVKSLAIVDIGDDEYGVRVLYRCSRCNEEYEIVEC